MISSPFLARRGSLSPPYRSFRTGRKRGYRSSTVFLLLGHSSLLLCPLFPFSPCRIDTSSPDHLLLGHWLWWVEIHPHSPCKLLPSDPMRPACPTGLALPLSSWHKAFDELVRLLMVFLLVKFGGHFYYIQLVCLFWIPFHIPINNKKYYTLFRKDNRLLKLYRIPILLLNLLRGKNQHSFKAPVLYKITIRRSRYCFI